MKLPGWSNELTVVVSNPSATSALAYHQVPFSISGAFYADWAANGLSNGNDLRVLDSDGTPLKFARERIDAANSRVYFLAKVPRVPPSGSRTIFLNYGNASAPDASDYAGTVGPTDAVVGPSDIYTQADAAGYNAEPHLMRLRRQTGGNASHNGDLINIIGYNAVGNGGNVSGILKMVSTDSGGTWSKTPLIAPVAAKSNMPRATGELLDGTVLLIYNAGDNTLEQASKATFYCATSSDAGATWSNLSATPTNPISVPWTTGTHTGGIYGKVFPRPNGDVWCVASGNTGGDPVRHVYILKCPSGSDPKVGSNWVQHAQIAYDAVHDFVETDIEYVASRDVWIAVHRCNNSPWDLYLTTSTDGTATAWGTPARMGLPNCTSSNFPASPYLLTMPSGNVVLGFGMRQGTTLFGSGYYVSTDGGRTFLDRPAAAPASYAPGAIGAFEYGYPSMDYLADGTFCASAYHGVPGTMLTNIDFFKCTEDYLLNCNNVFRDCDSTTGWTTAANVSVDTTNKVQGTGSLRINNNLGTGQNMSTQLWPTNSTGMAALNCAYSAWWRIEANAAVNTGVGIQDAASAFRCNCVALNVANTLQWYNGATYTNNGVVVAMGEWTKVSNVFAATPTTLAGKILKNNVDTGMSQGQYAAGGLPQVARFSTGSGGGTNNNILNVDVAYSHQFAATPPTVSVGFTPAPPSASGAAALLAGM